MNIAAFAKHVLPATLLLPATNLAAAEHLRHMPAGQKSLEFVAVGDPGNVTDARYGSYGAVGYTYQIGKYDVTAGTICRISQCGGEEGRLRAIRPPNVRRLCGLRHCPKRRAGAPLQCAPGRAGLSVNCVTWADAARVRNWLTTASRRR